MMALGSTESVGGRIVDAEAARTYILGGHATVTLVSLKSGTRFTYRVVAAPPRPSNPARGYWISLLTGPDQYAFLGTLFIHPQGSSYMPGRRSRVTADAPSQRALAWAWSELSAGRIPVSLEVWHDGRCGRCGRQLTTPESVATGIGPICASRG